jgi:hypothetical protein
MMTTMMFWELRKAGIVNFIILLPERTSQLQKC